MPKKVAIIGSGTAGLLFAHKLLNQGGYAVSLFSDRTAEQWLNESVPTGSAFAYGISTEIERAAGLNDYTQQTKPGDGILFDFVPTTGAERISLAGKFSNAGAAVDLRLRIHDWMHYFQQRGGDLQIESITMERLIEISNEFDDVFVAAGKGEISQLFDRNLERPYYPKPARKLIMMITERISDWADRSHINNGVRFNFFADAGEMFYVPYHHKSGQECYNILFEAKEGGYMDVFDKSMSTEELNETAKQWLQQHTPWDAVNIKSMQPISGDTFSTLQGAVPPHVKNDYGVLPNGNPVFPLGDSWAVFDPIGGQGFNNGCRQTDFIADRFIELGQQSASIDWAQENYEYFYQHHTHWATLFNNLLLEPLDEVGMSALLYAANNRRYCDEILFGQFHAPKPVYQAFSDKSYAEELFHKYGPFMNNERQIPEWLPTPLAQKLEHFHNKKSQTTAAE